MSKKEVYMCIWSTIHHLYVNTTVQLNLLFSPHVNSRQQVTGCIEITSMTV